MGEGVGILIEVAEHVVVLGAEIIVAAVFGEDERVEKQSIAVVGGFSEERAAGAGEGFFLYLAEQAEDFLSGFSLDDFLAHLEAGDQFLGLVHLGQTQAFEGLGFHPALLEGAGELGLQFGADEFEDGQASEDVDGGISRDLGAIQDGKVKRHQQAFEVAGGGFATFRGTFHRGTLKRSTLGGGSLHSEQCFDSPEEADVAGKMRAQLFSYARAQVHVIAQVVHAELKVGQGDG